MAKSPSAKVAAFEETKGLAAGIEQRIIERHTELADLKPVAREILERRISQRLDVIDAYLTQEKLVEKLERSSLSQIGIYEGIYLDKLAGLRGAPNAGLSMQDHAKLDVLLPALMKTMEQRGLTATLTERKAEFKLSDSPSTSEPTAQRPVSDVERAVTGTGLTHSEVTGPGSPVQPVELLPACEPNSSAGSPN